jgi:hypothetical protein
LGVQKLQIRIGAKLGCRRKRRGLLLAMCAEKLARVIVQHVQGLGPVHRDVGELRDPAADELDGFVLVREGPNLRGDRIFDDHGTTARAAASVGKLSTPMQH